MPLIHGEKVDVAVEDLGYRLRIRVSTRRHWAMYAGIGIVLAVMGPGTWFAVAVLTQNGLQAGLPVQGPRLLAWFSIAFALGWGIITLIVASLLVQMLAGYEEIEVGGGKLVSRVRPIGLTRRYSTMSIRDLRLDHSIPDGLARGDYRGWDSPPLPITPITFEADGRTVQIGRTMYEPEALQVLVLLRERTGLGPHHAGQDCR